MNKIVLGLVLSISCVMGLEFHSFEEAKQIQKKNGKVIMIDFVRTDCHYCEDMQKDVFNNKEMSAWLESRFIPVQINIDHDKMPIDVEVHFTPMFYFLNKENKIVKKIPGAWNIEDFKDLTKGIK